MPPIDVKTQAAPNQAPGTDTIIADVMNNLNRMRFFRRQYDTYRAGFYRMYLSQRDGMLFPDNLTPRSNTFIPYPYSQVNTVVSRTMDAFFSMDPPIETRQRGVADEGAAEPLQAVLLTMLRRCGWLLPVEEHVRNIAIYGHAGIKVDWDWDFDMVSGPEPVYMMIPEVDSITGQPILDQNGQPVQLPFVDPNTGMKIQIGTQMVSKPIPRMRPKFTPIDVFDLLVDPDGKQKAHLTEKAYPALIRESQANPKLYDPDGIAKLTKAISAFERPEEIIIRLAEYWDDTTKTVSVITFAEDAEAISWKDLRYSYRGATHSRFKRRVYGGPSILLYRGPYPHVHQRCPILDMSYSKLPNEVFGIGVIEIIRDLTDGLNRFVNMITDNWNLGINRRYAYDNSLDFDQEALTNANVPGGKVGCSGDPTKMIMPLPFFTPNSQDYEILGIYKNMIELGSGISDFYSKGLGSSGGNRTATGINQMSGETNYTFRMFIRNYETQILQPMLEMCASMIQQYCPDEVEYEITDAPPGIPKMGRVPLQSLLGDYVFSFVGANYATNKMVRQRNMMAWYNVVSQSPYSQPRELLKEMAKVMEIPNPNRLLKSEQQVQQEQLQAEQQQIRMMVFQSMLQTESKVEVAETQAKSKAGRPAKTLFEGQLPGIGSMGIARTIGQLMGANGTGLPNTKE